MPRASLLACFGLFALSALAACHASVKASVNADDARGEPGDTEVTTAPAQTSTPAPTPVTAAAVPVTPSAPPADACPLTCYEARGGQAAPLTAEEVTQLRSSLEPVLGRMRGCTTAEDWRRHGSPVINLRIAPDGTLNELGVDPHHGHQSSCFDDVGRGASASVSLPNRKVVRCAERCVRETPRRGSRRAR